MTASFGATLLTQMEFISPDRIHLSYESIFENFEVWRTVTNFCYFGKFSFPFVFSMFFLIRYGKELEAKRFEGRSADFLWCLAFTGLIQIVINYFMFGMPFLSQSMLSVIVYVWAREYADQILSMFGLFNIQGFYFPWCLVAIRVLMGGSPVPDLLGIFAGHVYYFLEDVQGVRLKAPAVLANFLDAGVNPQQPRTTAFGGHAWGGGGQRLAG